MHVVQILYWEKKYSNVQLNYTSKKKIRYKTSQNVAFCFPAEFGMVFFVVVVLVKSQRRHRCFGYNPDASLSHAACTFKRNRTEEEPWAALRFKLRAAGNAKNSFPEAAETKTFWREGQGSTRRRMRELGEMGKVLPTVFFLTADRLVSLRHVDHFTEILQNCTA